MKVCFVTTIIPSLTSGSAVRNYYLLRALEKTYGKDLSVLCAAVHCTASDIATYSSEFRIKTEFVKVPTMSSRARLGYLLKGKIPYLEHLKQVVVPTSAIRKADIILLQELNAYALIEKSLPLVKGILILDAHNIDAKKFQFEIESKSISNRIIGKMLIPTFTSYEISAITRCDYLLTCSEVDKQYFAHYISKKKITVVTNGVDSKYFTPLPHREKNTLVFMGLLSYLPNEIGLKWYITEIHPLVKALVPDVKVSVIGKNPPEWLASIPRTNPEFTITGFVTDVRQYIAKANVCICPLKDGSGTRLKLLEYLAMEKPTVSTTIGAQGLDVKENRNLILADSSKDFALGIVYLLQHPKEAKQIASRGRVLVKKHYSWVLIQKAYIQKIALIAEAIGNK